MSLPDCSFERLASINRSELTLPLTGWPLQKLGGLLESLLENGTIADGVLAQDETQVQSLWSLRESLPEAAGKLGRVYKYDLSMPVKDMYSLVEEARERFRDHGIDEIKTTVGYGHIGDGEQRLLERVWPA